MHEHYWKKCIKTRIRLCLRDFHNNVFIGTRKYILYLRTRNFRLRSRKQFYNVFELSGFIVIRNYITTTYGVITLLLCRRASHRIVLSNAMIYAIVFKFPMVTIIKKNLCPPSDSRICDIRSNFFFLFLLICNFTVITFFIVRAQCICQKKKTFPTQYIREQSSCNQCRIIIIAAFSL